MGQLGDKADSGYVTDWLLSQNPCRGLMNGSLELSNAFVPDHWTAVRMSRDPINPLPDTVVGAARS